MLSVLDNIPKYLVKKKDTHRKWFVSFLYGSPNWARTSDIMINSHALYRLSYRGILWANAHRKPDKRETKLKKFKLLGTLQNNSSSPRSISIVQLNTLLYLHLRPIKLVVYKWPYFLKGMGYLILRYVSRLDAFSVYHDRTRLPGYALGRTTDAPEVRPTRSSRTKVSSSQISYAHDR